MRAVRIGTLVTALGVMGTPGAAWACKPRLNPPHQPAPGAQLVDAAPPSRPRVLVAEIRRGRSPDVGCGGAAGTSCDDLGRIVLVVFAEDEATARADLGYRLRVISGKLPTGLAVPIGDIRGFDDPENPGGAQVLLHWNDGMTDGQESFSFRLSIAAVDAASHVGEAVEVQIASGGGGGCRMGTRGRPPAVPALATAALVLALAVRGGRRRDA